MDKKEHIAYWLKSAEHDLSVAESLFNSEKYDYCLFIGHLILEKVLKAFWVRDNENNTPPKLHDLVQIVMRTQLNLSEDSLKQLRKITRFNIDTRYPDYKFSFYKECTKEYTEQNFQKIKELYQWLLMQI